MLYEEFPSWYIDSDQLKDLYHATEDCITMGEQNKRDF